MADLKISELTAKTALAGTEEVPFALNSANGKTTVADIGKLILTEVTGTDVTITPEWGHYYLINGNYSSELATLTINAPAATADADKSKEIVIAFYNIMTGATVSISDNYIQRDRNFSVPLLNAVFHIRFSLSYSGENYLSLFTDSSDANGVYATSYKLSEHSSNVSNPHSVTKAQIGLSNADNTSDADKPISTAQAAVNSSKQDALVSGTSIKTVNGASLLGSGDLTVSSDPEVVTVTDAAAAITPEWGKIYDVKGTGGSLTSLTVSLPAAPSASNQLITIRINCVTAAPTITWPSSSAAKWIGDVPASTVGAVMEVSIAYFMGIFMFTGGNALTV